LRLGKEGGESTVRAPTTFTGQFVPAMKQATQRSQSHGTRF
jgi:hypothetical protein